MNIYVIQVVILLLICLIENFGNITEESKKHLFVFSTLLLFAVLFLRHYRIGSDLGRYHTHFVTYGNMAINDIVRISNLDNKGYYIYNAVLYKLFSGNYQAFIAITSIITFFPVVRMIKRTIGYSSTALYIYAGMGFYAFIFSGLKQAMAMSILCYSLIGIFEHRRFLFYISVFIASFFHLPALVFLPAYELTHVSSSGIFGLGTAIVSIVIFSFRSRIITFLGENYDSVIRTTAANDVGGKVILIVAICVYGYFFYRPNNQTLKSTFLFRLMIVAAALQTFAGYGNVFERLADYYFVYVSLYLPQIFSVMYAEEDEMVNDYNQSSIFQLSVFMVLIAVLVYFWVFYRQTPGMLPYKMWVII